VPPAGAAVISVGEIENVHALASVTVNDLPAIVRVAVLEIEPVLAAAV
jgi:hypothetical protein